MDFEILVDILNKDKRLIYVFFIVHLKVTSLLVVLTRKVTKRCHVSEVSIIHKTINQCY